MAISINYIRWKQLAGLRYVLYSIFFFFMPFTQALTFNIGFPLKFSELALFVLFFLYILLRRRVAVPKPIIILIGTLFFIVSLSFLVNLFWSYGYPLKEHETRFGYNGDSIARY